MSNLTDKLRVEIRADLLKEINDLKTVIEKQAIEISDLKRQAQFHSKLKTDLDTLAEVTHGQMRREIANNIIISGLPEDSENDSSNVDDILTRIDCRNCEVLHLERVGRATLSRPRLLKAKFSCPSDRMRVIHNSRRLRNDAKFSGVYLNPPGLNVRREA